MFEEHTAQNCWRAPGGPEPWAAATGCWARCCSPKPAIAALASADHHHRQFVPSLVPNHPVCSAGMKITPVKSEYSDVADLPRKKRKISSCVGCGSQIHDQYILRVAPDLEWHAACLKCADCQQFLDENCTCFVRDGKTYCKRDYVRLFGTKCDKCKLNFNKNDLVMRAKTKIYHIDCFRCNACQKQLIPGDEFALREDGLFCKEDHEELTSKSIANGETNNNNETTTSGHRNGGGNGKSNNNSNANGCNAASNGNDVHRHSNSSSNSSSSSCGSTNNHRSSHNSSGKSSKHHVNSVTSDSVVHHRNNEGSNSDSSECGSTPRYSTSGRDPTTRSGSSKVSSDGKPTRVRTVLNEKQLHTLRTCYSANPRPDALMKEQLVDMTGLSPRVIRVWFQNKRCKDKKRAIAMKQQLQQEKDGRKMGYGSMQGIPMVASSPVRHESPIGISPIEVQSYPAPWKALSDFALHTDLDRLDPSAPHFQQLVNQMHGYDLQRPLGVPHPEMIHQQSSNGPLGPLSDLIHQDSTESLITYMESDDSITHDGSSP